MLRAVEDGFPGRLRCIQSLTGFKVRLGRMIGFPLQSVCQYWHL